MNSLSCLRAGCDFKEAWNSSAVLLDSAEALGLLVSLEDSDIASWKTSNTAVWLALPGSLFPHATVQCGQGSPQA